MKLYVTKAYSFKEKTLGFIGKKTITPLYFETRWGIHTFGVKHTIDVIILDEHNVVKVLKKNLKPNRIFLWNPTYKKVIELPSGMIKKKGLKVGISIILIP